MQAIQAMESMELVNSALGNFPASRIRKIYKERPDPFDALRDEEFRRRYRFSKATARYVISIVRSDLLLDRRGAGTSPELQVLTAIRCWGRREVQEDAGDHHGLSRATTAIICARVARALARHSADLIKMPDSREELQVMREFAAVKNMPSIIGCIDCTHVKIRKVGGDTAEYYVNRKGFSSLNIQVVCDAKLKIRDIVARWRGSTHDARIFHESTLKQRFEAGEFRGRLLGDSGYKLEPYLFTPILRPSTRACENYNQAHISTRNTVERCFGVWKQRFQCLLFGMTGKLCNVKTTIVALAVLHNIAISHGDELQDPEEVISINPQGRSSRPTNVERGRNRAILQAFIIRHFSE